MGSSVFHELQRLQRVREGRVHACRYALTATINNKNKHEQVGECNYGKRKTRLPFTAFGWLYTQGTGSASVPELRLLHDTVSYSSRKELSEAGFLTGKYVTRRNS